MATLYTAPTGNGRKPLILVRLLKEAPIKVHLFKWPTPEVKQEWYLKLNPNGLIPTFVDPSKEIELYESNNLLEYLAFTYDTERKFHYSLDESPQLHWQQNQWLFFQGTQYAAHTLAIAVIYTKKNPNDAFTREFTLKNFNSIFTTLETQLSKSESGWFIGDKFTIVDIAFLCDEHRRREVTRGTDWWIDVEAKYPRIEEWYQRALNFENVKQILEEPISS
ncbi:uncharacterized protein LODBEIA_P16700 [Lodderomyces beijingensis]|uniref:Glutathione S-transferase n=1 Tax=Lodderomyces beijingensis TaxID=1775926 RepID=A0ABP0ZJX9_9ASCO